MYKPREVLTLGLLFSGMAFSYMDRAIFGVLAPQIQADLGLNAAELGLALGFFSIGYTLLTFFGGLLADRFGPKVVLGAAMVVWSAFCAMTGLVGTLASLLIVRFAFGMAEAPAGPAIAKMVSAWFTPARYAGALGLVFAGASIGAAVAGPVAGILSGAFGWRLSFVVVGALGLAWLACWLFLARDTPPEAATDALSRGAATGPSAVAGDASSRSSIAVWLRHPTVVAAAIGNFALGYILYFFISWFPSYLIKDLGMNLTSMSWAASLPWLIGGLGVVIGGYASDYLVQRFGNEVRARKAIIVGGLAMAGVCVALAPTFATPVSAVLLISGAKFFIFMTSPNYSALVRTTVPQHHFGGAVGFVTFTTNAAGIAAPIITGLIVQGTGSYSAAFLFAGAVVVSGALAVALLGNAQGGDARRVRP